MKFILEEQETMERGINHWILQSDLTEKEYSKFEKESDIAYDFYEAGDWKKAVSKYAALLSKYGIEAMDAFSFLSVMYANKKDKLEVLGLGHACIMQLLDECGYKPQDRIEYGYIHHRPLYRLLYNIANFYVSENVDREKGFKVFELIYSNNPENDNQGIRYHLVWHYIDKGRLDDAFNICKPLVNDDYHDDELAYAASLIALKRGNLEAGRKYFAGAFKNMPLFGHMLLQHHEDLARFVDVCGQNHNRGIIQGSLNEALIIYKKSWALWKDHLDVSKNESHRSMIFNTVRRLKGVLDLGLDIEMND